MVIATKDVPWQYEQTKLFESWTWDTQHFKATIFSEGKESAIFNWRVEDYTRTRSGKELASGQCMNYADAKDSALEIVGKSYPPTLQYKRFAGSLATSFYIGTGEYIDFGEFESHKVNLYCREKASDPTMKIFTGALECVHHKIHLTTDSGQVIKIPPRLIFEVRGEFSATAVKGKTETEKMNERARIYSGDWTQGCTGHPGHVFNTVEHNPTDNWCPIHEKH